MLNVQPIHQKEKAHDTSTVFFQPKLTTGQPVDEHEREADAVADKVLNAEKAGDSFFKPSPINIRRKCRHCEEEQAVQRKAGENSNEGSAGAIGKYVNNLNNSGSPMPAKEKSFFEAKMGYDFSGVRIHNNSEANQSAKNINALAYTHGNNIVFGQNQYNPSSTDGKKLIAHELTHVVQQGGNNNTSIQRKTPPVVEPLFVKHAKENLEDLKKRRGVKLYGGSTYYPKEVRTAKKYLAFAEAVANKDKAAIPAMLKDLLTPDLDDLSPDFPIIEDLSAIIASLMELGLDNEVAKLQSFTPVYVANEEKNDDPFAYKIYLWDFILANLPKATDAKDATQAANTMVVWLKYMGQLVTQALDTEPLVKGKKKPEPSQRHGNKTAFDFLDALRGDFSAASVQFEILYQQLLDKAISDLQSGKGNASLEIVKSALNALKSLKPPDGLINAETEVTKTVIPERGGIYSTGKHVDYFIKGKEAKKHTEDIELYDPHAENKPAEKEMSQKRIFEIRDKQITALEQLYGFKKDPNNPNNLTAEAKENAAVIQSIKHLELNNDDDWRKFLLKKYEMHKAAVNNDTAKAFDAVIDTIRMYMNAFTLHTPYNIVEDAGVNQLQIKFPRALTRQLIHDCGVYALRIVYMLSLLKDHPDLKLNIKFIKLPLHTGLIITGKGLPTYLAHNDMIKPMDAAELAGRRKDWNKETTKMGKDPADDDQFMGEMAAEEFIPGAMMPFRLETVKPIKDSKNYAGELWKFYMSNIVPDVFSKSVLQPTDKNYRLHLMYLEVLEMYKNFYNTSYRDFWNNTVVVEWKKNKSALQAAAGDKFTTLFEAYKRPVMDAYNKADSDFYMIRNKLKEIEAIVKANPDMIASKTRVTDAARMVKVAGDWMELQRDTAIDTNVNNMKDKREIAVDPLD